MESLSALAAGAWTALFALGLTCHKLLQERRRSAFAAWTGERETLGGSAPHASAAMLIADVIARLKSGVSVEAAWRGALTDAGFPWRGMDSEGVPTLPAELDGAASSVEAACRLTHRIGAPLAQILQSVLETIDEAEAATRDRAVARAGPQATAKLLSALPLVGVVASASLGIDVLSMWAKGGIATIALGLGIALWVAGIVWSKHMIAAAAKADEAVDPVVMIDLLIASLLAGASIPHSLEALGAACREPQFTRCAALLRIGAPFDALQEQIDARLLPVIDALRPAWTLGASPTPTLRLLAGRIRASRASHAREEAEKLAVRLVLPLGLLLLPAFVAIAIVPIVASINLPGF